MYKEYGGGYLYNWGPHLIGVLLDLLGEPITRVYSEKKQIINPGDTEDMFYAMMKTKSGILVNVEHNINTDFLPNWVVRGSKGTVYVTGKVIEIHEVSHPEEIDPNAYRNPYNVAKEKITLDGLYNTYDIYSHIAKVIKGEMPYKISMDWCRHMTEVIDAIHKSADTDKIIYL